MNNIARPKLKIPVRSSTSEAAVDKSGKKAADPRIQKLNTILGPRGIRADELLKRFDALTSEYAPETMIPVYLKIAVDGKGKSIEYEMTLGMPATSDIVKKKLNLTLLAAKPNLKTPIYTANKTFVDEIIKEKTKFIDRKFKYEALFKSIVGSLNSFGIKYVEQ